MLRFKRPFGNNRADDFGAAALRAAQLPPKSILSPERTPKPGMRRPDICRSDWISLENRFPAPA